MLNVISARGGALVATGGVAKGEGTLGVTIEDGLIKEEDGAGF